jgi:hypothetical protein
MKRERDPYFFHCGRAGANARLRVYVGVVKEERVKDGSVRYFLPF